MERMYELVKYDTFGGKGTTLLRFYGADVKIEDGLVRVTSGKGKPADVEVISLGANQYVRAACAAEGRPHDLATVCPLCAGSGKYIAGRRY
jgi:hypothetical protein